jgi:hypothetical protein
VGGWVVLGETEYDERCTRIAVLGVEGLKTPEGMKEMIRHGLEKGERKGIPVGGGEAALRVAMESWPRGVAQRLIEEVDASMNHDSPRGKVSLAEVKRVKSQIGVLTRGPLDKGGKQLYCECGKPHTDRVQTMVIDSTDYGVKMESEEETFLQNEGGLQEAKAHGASAMGGGVYTTGLCNGQEEGTGREDEDSELLRERAGERGAKVSIKNTNLDF